MLLALKVVVLIDHIADGIHIWYTYFPVGLDEAVHVVRILPAIYFLEEAEVRQNACRCAPHARRTMNIHV